MTGSSLHSGHERAGAPAKEPGEEKKPTNEAFDLGERPVKLG